MGFVGAIGEIEPVEIDFAIQVVAMIGYDVHANLQSTRIINAETSLPRTQDCILVLFDFWFI